MLLRREMGYSSQRALVFTRLEGHWAKFKATVRFAWGKHGKRVTPDHANQQKMLEHFTFRIM